VIYVLRKDVPGYLSFSRLHCDSESFGWNFDRLTVVNADETWCRQCTTGAPYIIWATICVASLIYIYEIDNEVFTSIYYVY